MKYVYIILIGALLIGCGASDDGDKGNSGGGASAKGGNTASGTPATKGDNTSGTPATKGSNTSGTPKTKGDNTSTPPTKGDIGASTKYTEGDIVIILKNANKSYAKIYSSATRDDAKEKGLTTLSKDLASESCVSLGFVYKTTANEDGATVKEFTKGDVTCSERTVIDSTLVGSFNLLFLLRK